MVFAIYKRMWGSLRLPPGPRPWPVVGNLMHIAPVRFKCFMEWAQTYGPVMSVWMGPTLNVVISSADAAREMLKEKDQALSSRPLSRAAARFSRNGQALIWADYGPHYVGSQFHDKCVSFTLCLPTWCLGPIPDSWTQLEGILLMKLLHGAFLHLFNATVLRKTMNAPADPALVSGRSVDNEFHHLCSV
ncbi:hypothetical protein M758_4G082400 [Ceratodon purpureus]|nr:hypothetical protein M758_4G082400 [Ceratodon purpureus]